MDISLVSVIATSVCSLIVSLATLWFSYRQQTLSAKIQARSQLNLLDKTHRNQLESEKKTKQSELLSIIFSYAVSIDRGDLDSLERYLSYLIQFRTTMQSAESALDNHISALSEQLVSASYKPDTLREIDYVIAFLMPEVNVSYTDQCNSAP